MADEGGARFRSGFAALIGRPNVGKSTLLNHLVGSKVSIVSDKPQTTRNRIQAVLTRPDAQIVFIDTPGIHKPRHLLGEHMVRSAEAALGEVDAVVFVVDGGAGVRAQDEAVAERLAGTAAPVILAVNKLDRVPAGQREAVLATFAGLGAFAGVLGVSALTGLNTGVLVDRVVACLPAGPKYYPDDWLIDQPERFVIQELIREQVLARTQDEVPHAVAVFVEEMAAREGTDLVDVRATIYCERESQKGILIGKGGRVLREVGTGARRYIEALLGSRVFLQLWVKVRKDWRESERALREFGLQ